MLLLHSLFNLRSCVICYIYVYNLLAEFWLSCRQNDVLVPIYIAKVEVTIYQDSVQLLHRLVSRPTYSEILCSGVNKRFNLHVSCTCHRHHTSIISIWLLILGTNRPSSYMNEVSTPSTCHKYDAWSLCCDYINDDLDAAIVLARGFGSVV